MGTWCNGYIPGAFLSMVSSGVGSYLDSSCDPFLFTFVVVLYRRRRGVPRRNTETPQASPAHRPGRGGSLHLDARILRGLDRRSRWLWPVPIRLTATGAQERAKANRGPCLCRLGGNLCWRPAFPKTKSGMILDANGVKPKILRQNPPGAPIGSGRTTARQFLECSKNTPFPGSCQAMLVIFLHFAIPIGGWFAVPSAHAHAKQPPPHHRRRHLPAVPRPLHVGSKRDLPCPRS